MSEIKKTVGRYVPGSLSMKRAPAYWVWRSEIETIRFPFFFFRLHSFCVEDWFIHGPGPGCGRDQVSEGCEFARNATGPWR